MPKPTKDPTQYAAGKPLEVGVSSEQMQEMREEIAHSGVANRETYVEASVTPGRKTGSEAPSTISDENVAADEI